MNDDNLKILFKAVIGDNKNQVESILSSIKEFDIDTKDEHGWTLLHRAAVNDKSGITQLLIQYGAAINSVGTDGWTPLHLAAISGNAFSAKVLIDNNADINAKAKNGNTPLHLTTISQHAEIAKKLIEHGARVDQKNKELDTPLTMARHKKALAIEALLK